MKSSIKLLSLLIAGLVLSTGATARDFRCSDSQPIDYPTALTVKKIGEIISQKTNGRYGIKLFPNNTLGQEKDAVEQVKIGAIDMARVNISMFNGVTPETMIPLYPFIFRDIQHFRKTIYGAPGEKIRAAVEKSGYIALALWEGGSRSIYGKKPVHSLADAKGMKIRVQGSDLMIGLVQAMGATPTPIPFGEVYTALKTGLVDAAENNYSSFEAQKHYEAAPFYSETQHVMSPEILVFSKKVWDTLTKEDQKIIRDAAMETVPYYVNLWEKQEKAAKEIVTKAGVTFVTDVKKEEFVTAMKPVWDKFTTTPEMKAIVDEIVNTK